MFSATIEVAELKTITKADVLVFYRDLLSIESNRRHKISVHVMPPAMANIIPAVDAPDIAAPDGVNVTPAPQGGKEVGYRLYSHSFSFWQ